MLKLLFSDNIFTIKYESSLPLHIYRGKYKIKYMSSVSEFRYEQLKNGNYMLIILSRCSFTQGVKCQFFGLKKI